MWNVLEKFFPRKIPPWDATEPIRAELFGLERLREHAHSLARSQMGLNVAGASYSVVRRLRDNTASLSEAYKDLCNAIAKEKPVTPAAEWLVDNFHLIEEQARQAAIDLPKGYYKQLPKIAVGPLSGHPKIFGIAWAYVAHTDSRFDPHSLAEFINAYQDVQPLTIGELWAAAISLRLVMIENLARISSRNVAARRAREAADDLVSSLINRKAEVEDIEAALSPDTVEHVALSFAVQLIKRLRGHDAVDSAVHDWLRQKVGLLGYDFESAVNEEHHRQAVANVSMRNLVMSLRLISDYAWEEWFDSVSEVDKLLRNYPLYGEMDFRTRNNYRSAIEDLSQHSECDEIYIVHLALERAALTTGDQSQSAGDPGYHILGGGRESFEIAIGYRPPLNRRVADGVRRAGLTGYIGLVLTFAMVTLGLGLWPLTNAGISGALLLLLAVAGSGLALEVGVAMLNFAVTQLLRPVVLPGLALRDGVPQELCTLVVVPCLLTTREAVEELIEQLEVHYLANSAGELYFALLSDWTDSDTLDAPDDEALLLAALGGVARLNQQYGQNRFLLLHRKRLWNPQQGKWMGWERKRGKLHELNRLLRGETDTNFMVIGGKLPAYVRFVITLDADTKFPRDAARRLVGKIAHPLNRPCIDAGLLRVVEGYGILQPRVAPSLPARGNGSLFQRIFSTRRGSDPYVFAVSDVYQDMFGEGSFAGKGIYDIDAFETTLSGRIPDNTMLSHDLFEGNFVRTALVSDIEVVEEYPERYTVAAARQHRWVRGDWQLLPWIVGCAPAGASGKAGPQSALGLWKMIDNLRRSLGPVLSLLALFAGWLWLPGPFVVAWTIFIVFAAFVPAILPMFAGSGLRSTQLSINNQLQIVANDAVQAISLTAANFIFLAHQAVLMADAIGRTLFRLFVSRRHLLEWMTAAQVESSTHPGLNSAYRLMIGSVVIGLLSLAIVIARGNTAISALPFVLLWLAAPAIAWRSSQPDIPADELTASPGERLALRLVARRTWRYFETFVVAADNFLPPDNFQEDPVPVIAHRTSPTNIGLYLLSIASAREFGWIGLDEAITRIETTLATLGKMEKHRGHLYNWYDTQTLLPLEPKYVSSVDSGNLTGHLIALANICSYWLLHPTAGAQYLEGIGDSAEILREELSDLALGGRSHKTACAHAGELLAAFRRSLDKAAKEPERLPIRLIDLAVQSSAIHDAIVRISTALETSKTEEPLYWARTLRETVESHFQQSVMDSGAVAGVKTRLEAIASTARQFAMDTQFGFLSDPERYLMSIGYRVTEGLLDESCYDLLASEASLASFVAIAKGDLRTRHWFRLGRPVTALPGGAALVSWSGSMFEYLMPRLVLQAPSGSLIEQTEILIVRRQINYAKKFGMPWGISESAFSARDMNFTYQYSNFGVPGLGLKRGLSSNLVIAPYATGLAAMVAPKAAVENFVALDKVGGRGQHGYYEALDFTPSRLREGQNVSIVRAYFAHHQGMTIAAILNAVNNNFIRAQFHGDPIVRATELLLQERAPQYVPEKLASTVLSSPAENERNLAPSQPRLVDPRHAPSPSTHLLSNGHYTVMLTAAGGGYSAWNGVAINRWREDATGVNWGSFVFLRDIGSGATWTTGYMPAVAEPASYSAVFCEEKAEFHRTDGKVTTSMECLVSTEDNAEARRVTIINNGFTARMIELTTYMELALAPFAADDAHPAFSKLFIETEYVEELTTLLATRRRRSPTDPEVWVAQFILGQGPAINEVEYETSRAQFLGQGNDVTSASAMTGDAVLSKTTGAVLDPVFAQRRRVRVLPGQQVCCTIWTLVADSREAVLDMVDRHRQQAACERARILAWTQSRIQLRHLSIDIDEADLFQRLAGHLIYANTSMRASSRVIQNNIPPQSALWPQGISGNKPILLARIDAAEDIGVIRQLLRAHEYWSAKRLAVDLVILNDRRASYMQDLQVEIDNLVRKMRISAVRETFGITGQVYALRADLLPRETHDMLPAVARVVINAHAGSLANQVARADARTSDKPITVPQLARERPSATQAVAPTGLGFFNGYGGFDEGRGEYVILHQPGKPTPAPWINVIANPSFGTQCAADGAGYTWTGNSRECQITGWANDPVSNRPGEAIYLRDERSGILTGPCVAPLRHGKGTYRTRHGFGYTHFESEDDGLRMEYLQFVALTDRVKIARLHVTTDSTAPRQLSVTFYAELVLGFLRAAGAPFITTEIDSGTGALLAHNRWNSDFGESVVFVDMCGKQTAWTADRLEFLGAFGSIASPHALVTGKTLSNSTGGGLDPCAVLQQKITVAAGRPEEVTIILGAAANDAEARLMINRYRNTDIDAVFTEVKSHWSETLGAVKVKTPDPSFNIMMNGWLLYQTLACRMWGRSGLYQASGAYGFRDQLQDSIALAGVRPEISRQHILRAAARQFVEGDVQHWWLPTSGMGVRTRISDDTVWLSYCVYQYVKTTGDTQILDEVVPFLEGRLLEEGEHDAFYQPEVSEKTATLYEHCVRGLERNLPSGPHGLPLMGTGDWNDGMNRVGEHGKGESIWLGWFLYTTLKAFSVLAAAKGDVTRTTAWKTRMASLQQALDDHGWDGRWYRRGYFDDGTPLGSAQNSECKIDSIAQSWAVISGAARPTRARAALDESYRQLVKQEDGIALLFTPPFNKSLPDPGYVKAYPPGIRENGGQYSHGVIWSIFAHAMLGEEEKAASLFAMINPVNHARSEAEANRYKVEPYVMAGDVYSMPPHTGRGGWTWYTGAAGWMYRAGLEAILGFVREGSTLRIKPCVPPGWADFQVSLIYGATRYEITLSRKNESAVISQSHIRQIAPGEYEIELNDDGGTILLQLPLTSPHLEESCSETSFDKNGETGDDMQGGATLKNSCLAI